MDKALIDNWNSVVNEGDRVYVLGDVAINRRCLSTLGSLKGRLVLVKGNHDIFKLKDYLPYFDDIRAYVVGNTHKGFRYILSHIPIHPNSLARFNKNIHGHLHSNTLNDPRYICVSVEQTNYFPVDLNELIKD